MPIHPQHLIRDMQGRPQPSPELVAKLKAYDPRIGLFYTKASWAVTETWKEDDPRRQWIQNGSMQPEFAFDIVGYLPVTCSIDEAPAFIARELTSWAPGQFKGLREAVNHWNDVEQDKVTEDQVLSRVSDDLDRENIVSPGAYAVVPFDFSSQGTTEIKEEVVSPDADAARLAQLAAARETHKANRARSA